MTKDEAKQKKLDLQDEIKELDKFIKKPTVKVKEVKNLKDTIKTYKDVCKALKKKELTLEDFKFLPANRRIKALALQQLKDIEELFAEGTVFDFNNGNQQKHYPYAVKKLGGWVLSSLCYGCAGSGGEPAFYKDKITSDFCFNTFKDIYNNYLNN